MFAKLNIGTVFAIGCDSPYDVVTVPGTTIITPNYPHSYGVNLECQVTLTFQDRVQIIFEDFYLESSSCQFDWLEIHDGDDSNSDLIGEKLCGYSIPGPMESSGNSITLVFHSDSTYSYRGFEIMTHQGTL